MYYAKGVCAKTFSTQNKIGIVSCLKKKWGQNTL